MTTQPHHDFFMCLFSKGPGSSMSHTVGGWWVGLYCSRLVDWQDYITQQACRLTLYTQWGSNFPVYVCFSPEPAEVLTTLPSWRLVVKTAVALENSTLRLAIYFPAVCVV